MDFKTYGYDAKSSVYICSCIENSTSAAYGWFMPHTYQWPVVE